MRSLFVVVLALAISGCSTATGGAAQPIAGSDAPAAGDAVGQLAFVGPGDDGMLRLAMVEPASYRPDEVSLSDQSAVVIADLLYDGLTEVDGDTGTLEPALAEAWEADENYRRWTFHLEPVGGVGADAVVRALSPLLQSPEGAEPPARPGVALTAGMASVVALDQTTVRIELERPNAGLPWILSGLPFSIVDLDGTPTGDYEIVADDDAGLRLERRRSRGGGLGPHPIVELVWVDRPEDGYRSLVEGAVDGAVAGPSELADAERRFEATITASTAVRFYVLNPGSADLADRDHRAALLGLVDGPGLVAETARADLVAVDGLVSPSMVGYRTDSCGPACGELDDGSGGVGSAPFWPADVPLRVTYAGEGQAAVASALADRLVEAGLPATSRAASPRELAAAIVDGSPDLFAFGWVAPAASVDAVLPPLLRGESPANVARFASPGIEELLDTAAETGDDEARWAILDQAHRLALAEAKVLPVAASSGTLVLAPDHPGVVIRTDGSLDLERLD